MKRESLVPGSEAHWLSLRENNINSTESPALFADPETGKSASPYETFYELWHRFAGRLPPPKVDNDRVRWGMRLQDAIMQGVSEEKGWKINRINRYVWLPDYRLGSSFDCEIVSLPDRPILELKNVDGLRFKEAWPMDDDGNIGAPLHIEFQVQHQMGVMGRKKAFIAALVGGNKIHYIERDFSPQIFEAIKIKALAFFETLKVGVPPMPSFPEDAATVALLMRYSDKSKILDVGGNQQYQSFVSEYLEWSKQESLAKEQKDVIKAKLLMLMDGASKVVGDTFTISSSVSDIVEKKPRAYTRHNWKIAPKEKK